MMNSIARTLQKTILIFSASVLSLLSLPSFAQMSIEITGVGQSLYPIAVMRFKDENKLPTSVTDIIRQDLARSGYFKNIENCNASESGEDAPNYSAWAARGANALVVGSVVQKGADQFDIQYRLFDIRKSQSLGGLNINSSADNLRAAAPRHAEEII
jgi:TolB protein